MEPAAAKILVEGLPAPSSVEVLNIENLRSSTFVACDSEGAPYIFFELSAKVNGNTRQNTDGLMLSASSDYVFHDLESSTERRAAGCLIGLRDRKFIWPFATLVGEIDSILIADARAFSSQAKVDSFLDGWIKFFAEKQMSVEAYIGLWGELFVITQFGNIDRAVSSWVGPSKQFCDFSSNSVKLEIKTRLQTDSAWFNAQQIIGLEEGYSHFIKVSEDVVEGVDIADLVVKIRKRLRNPLLFEAKLIKSGYLGADGIGLKLRKEAAKTVLNSSIPVPTWRDERITAVKYRVEVDGLDESGMEFADLLRKMSD